MLHKRRLYQFLGTLAVGLVCLAITARVEAAPPPMLLPGQMDVSPSGAFTYTVPITVAPGTAGMVPSLSLEYSSQSGDGIVGLGWSLSGLPSIGRCPRTVAQDTIKGSVNYDANDRFCMEGQRLVAISGTYGANNTEYRTEIEGFSKVISYGAAGTGPAYFKVWTKSGQIMEFGNTTDSRILAQGKTTARSWAANKISDTKGNYLTVTYTNDTTNGQAYPTRIDYTGNAGASLTPYNSVRFTYNTSRPDQVPLYHAGSLQKTTVLLTNVKTYEGNNVVRDYQITYELGTSLRRSRVTQIKVCDNAANCLAPTTFGWQGTRDTIAVSSTQATGTVLADISIGMGSNGLTTYVLGGEAGGSCAGGHGLLGDWTGVGYSDIAVQKLRIPSGDPEQYDVWFCVGGVKKQKLSLTQVLEVNPVEFNGDGRLDFMKYGAVYLSNGDGFFTASGTLLGSPFDADGDGCADRLYGTTLYFSTFCPAAVASFAFPNWSGYETASGDFNGDGIPDFVLAHPTATGTVQLGTGRGYVQQSYTVPAGWASYDIHPADFNGDGRTDLALIAPNGVYVHLLFLSTGSGFVSANMVILNTNSEVPSVGVYPADWNDNGAADLWIQDLDGDTKYLFDYVPEFVNSVSNGLGIATTITYDRLNNPALYTKDTTGTYPQVDINGPLYVVSRVDSGNGIGGTYSSTYTYVGLKADYSGRGFLGFRQRIITDLQTNVVETTTFRQDYPYIGLVGSQTKVLGAVTLNSKTNTFAATSLGGTRYFVSLSQTVEASNDLNGASMPTITTAFQYDTYGNATQVSVTTPNGDSKVTNSTYTNDTTNWFLGRLATANQTNTVGGVGVTRQTSYAYNATSGLLTQEVIEPNDTPRKKITDYVYDAFGNKTSISLSGIDIQTCTTTIAYDTKGEFPLSATNCLNHLASQTFDPRHGQVTSTTDPNGLITTSTYDALGRATLEAMPDLTKVGYAYAYCSGVNGGSASCVSGGTFVATATPYATDGTTQNGPLAKAYYDTLARVIAADTQGFDGALIRAATQYDAFGRVAQVSRPYFVSGGTAKWMVNTYDAIGRVTDIQQPNNGHTTTTYNGLTVSVTNALSQTTTTVKNQQGLVASVTDNAGTTTYTYDPFENVKTITDSTGNVTTLTYDARGRKTDANDPDMGVWHYVYDVADRLVSQTDAKNQTTTLQYDVGGRLTQRTEPGLTSTWAYDGTNGKGKVASDSASNGASHTFAYDSLSRPITTTTTVDGNSYSVTTSYDANSRRDVVTYPSGFAVKHVYTALSYLSEIKNNATSSVLWTANTANAELQITQQTAGNGVVTNRAFDANTGLVQTIQAGPSNAVANLSFGFNAIGSLTSRGDATQSLSETFTYDNMNRLTNYDIASGSSKTVGYDALGNITSKSDVGTYAYPTPGSARPHAIGSITGTINTIFTYDANGNMLAGQGRTVTYTAFNMADTITQGSATVSLVYDANHSRIKQTAPDGTTIYVAGPVNVERFAATSGLVQWNEYLMAGSALVGVHFTRSDATQNTRHFVTDHLGSVAVLTDEMGAVVERLSYDAWGKRRFATGADDPIGSITSQTTKGFTGHEHIAVVGLINMNARIYDPTIGRFMTPDTLVEDFYLSQILNRYTYVGNNPLSIVDPTGRSWLSSLLRKIPILRAILSIAVAVIFQQPWAIGLFGEAGSVLAAGLASGFVSGGTLKSALLGGLTALAFYGVGELGLDAVGATFGQEAAHVFLHGFVGGLSSVAQGGDFGSGFLAAGFADLAGFIEGGSFGANLVIRTVAGGVASVLGGGKFENGAMTGAFGYLFNFCLHATRCNVDRRVYAAFDGRIVSVGWDDPLDPTKGAGLVVTIESSDGEYQVTYSHMDESSIRVRPGQTVVEGQRIGSYGNTGLAFETAPHLHFVVRQRAANGWVLINPLATPFIEIVCPGCIVTDFKGPRAYHPVTRRFGYHQGVDLVRRAPQAKEIFDEAFGRTP